MSYIRVNQVRCSLCNAVHDLAFQQPAYQTWPQTFICPVLKDTVELPRIPVAQGTTLAVSERFPTGCVEAKPTWGRAESAAPRSPRDAANAAAPVKKPAAKKRGR